VSTGTMTIPLMKKAGFKPHIAGAVEVAASTNGQLMPPVMGAAAFIMAEFTKIPYRTIVIAALLPAVLSYVAIFTMIHLEAVRTGMKAGRKEDLPSLRRTMLRGLLLNVPFISVIVFLLGLPAPIARMAAPYVDLTARTPTTSATLAIWVTIALFLLMAMCLPRTTYGLEGLKGHGIAARTEFFGQRIWLALRDAAINMIGIACACAACGIIIGVVSQTGLAGKLTSMVLSLSTAITMPSFLPQALPALLLTMVACLVLGIGLPTTATYIIMSTLTVTAILKLMAPDGNVDTSLMLATHLFVFYYGIMADDTPPVGLCAYAAAGIAGSDPVRTGLASFRFDLAAFTLPLIFFFNRELLLQDAHWLRLLHVVPFAIMGMMCFAAVLQGFAWDRLRWWERLILLAVSFLFVSPELAYSLTGLVVLGVLIVVHRVIAKPATA
jgi:TRAP transporter 4TM/12TM fusion protein